MKKVPSKSKPMFKDYYQILGIDDSATPQQIENAYQKLSLESKSSQGAQENAYDIERIEEAYLILGDERSRLLYDMEYEKYRSWQKMQEGLRDSIGKFYQLHENTAPPTETKQQNKKFEIGSNEMRRLIKVASTNAKAKSKEIIEESADIMSDVVKHVFQSLLFFVVFAAVMFTIIYISLLFTD